MSSVDSKATNMDNRPMVGNNLVGTITKDRNVVTEFREHFYERLEERGIASSEVANALKEPMHITEDRTDPVTGEVSKQYIGRHVTVAYNPNSRSVITAWRTGSRYVKKYGGDFYYDKA